MTTTSATELRRLSHLSRAVHAGYAGGGHDATRAIIGALAVSCGFRAHAQLPAVDLKSIPLTTRAN